MRRRATILADLQKDGDKISFKPGDNNRAKLTVGVNAPRQDRFSAPASDSDLDVLNHVADVSVSWGRPSAAHQPVLFAAAYEPGLHVTVVKKQASEPRKWGQDKPEEAAAELVHVAKFLEKQLGLPVDPKAFIESRSDYTYYDALVGPEAFGHFVDTHSACSDKSEEFINDLDSFNYAQSASFHIDHDKKELVAEVTLPDMEHYFKSKKQHVSRACKNDRLEVGIFDLNNQATSYAFRGVAELKGLLHDSTKENAQETFLVIEPRHNIAAGSVSVDFQRPVGLHPKSELKLRHIAIPADHNDEDDGVKNCRLFAKYSAPSSIFFDKYQLADLERKTSEHPNGQGRLLTLWGEADLEEPRYHTEGWGSEALVEIFPITDAPEGTPFNLNFTLPLHLRYEEPKEGETYEPNEAPWPLVFWVCGETDEQVANFKQSPFDVTHNSYMRLFPEGVSYHHVGPREANGKGFPLLTTSWGTPVADINGFAAVRDYTSIMIVGGFLVVTLAILRKVFGGQKVSEELKQKKEQ
ncbi:Protein PBN1 [Yarrowia sp. C11]|nr:Protein PBN1 [Yarrowia sp. C11]KAG5370842.1 Protein PBN1 [Yarrowia sp. E02]